MLITKQITNLILRERVWRNTTITTPVFPSRSISTARNTSEVLHNLRTKIIEREGGKPLSREWYTSDYIFDADMKFLWKKNWLFAGFECQIRSPGDYFTYEISNESILIIRGDDHVVRAFFNVCRHRGARLCPAEEGTVRNIVCPYHSWTYNKSGKLIKASHMEDQIFYDTYGLIPCNINTVEGLIFINLADKPTYPFKPAEEVFIPQLKHHRLKDAKIAYSRTDIVKANWKLVYENNRECYHCPNAHPDYIKANYDLAFSYIQSEDGKSYVRIVDPNHPRRDEVQDHIESCNQRWAKYDIVCSAHNNFPGDGWYRASRLPLRKGWVTESLDGKYVAPILGDFKEEDRDMGSMRIHTLPNFWIHISSDHAVATRLSPVDPTHTRADQIWLVHKDALEGKDYHLDKLLPFWDRTNKSDWEICELNQAGILSDRYIPAPYSLKKESGVETFIKWYLQTLSRGSEL